MREKIKMQCVKLDNRRVMVGCHDGSIVINFKRLGDKSKGESRVVETVFTLSKEAAGALAHLLNNQSHNFIDLG